MSTLTFIDTHNMVAFLQKPNESEGFEPIVDFLNVHPIRTFNFSKMIFDGMLRNLDSKEKFLMYPKFIQLFLDQEFQNLEGMPTHKSIYVSNCHAKKVFANMKQIGKGFSDKETSLFQSMVGPSQSEMGEGLGHPTDAQHTPSFDILPPQPKKKTQTLRKAKKKITESKDSPLIGANTPGSDEGTITLKELMKTCTKLSKRVLDLEKELYETKTSQQLNIESSERRVKRLEKKNMSRTHKLKSLYKIELTARVATSSDEEPDVDEEDTSKHGRSIADIDKNEQITLDNVYNVDIAYKETVLSMQDVQVKEKVTEEVIEVIEIAKIIVDEVSIAGVQDVNIANEELVSVAPTNITTAQPSETTKTNIETT
uniref:Synaptobrevin, longin-like domain protein n=1 Tax=Tanacetum cinerariifolium TaxID=118510 RepID=A0A6L2JWQ2_TANCI|nr:hypothetical protein [Tanacetum cinerariifolium]